MQTMKDEKIFCVGRMETAPKVNDQLVLTGGFLKAKPGDDFTRFDFDSAITINRRNEEMEKKTVVQKKPVPDKNEEREKARKKLTRSEMSGFESNFQDTVLNVVSAVRAGESKSLFIYSHNMRKAVLRAASKILLMPKDAHLAVSNRVKELLPDGD